MLSFSHHRPRSAPALLKTGAVLAASYKALELFKQPGRRQENCIRKERI